MKVVRTVWGGGKFREESTYHYYREPITIAIVCLIGLIGYGCGGDAQDNNESPIQSLGSDPAEDDSYGLIPVDSNLNDREESHKNLDPDVLNCDGIVIECNKTIFTTDLVLALVGSIKKSTLDVGESIRESIPLNWARTVEDKTVRFERGNGSPLQFNKTYIIHGDLGDEFENIQPVFLKFTTLVAPSDFTRVGA